MWWIPLVTALGGAFIGSKSNQNVNESQVNASFALQKDAQQYNATQAELAYDRTVEFYEKYQSPYAMIESAKKAGINPFSIGGSAGSGSSISAPVASSGSNNVGSLHSVASLLASVAEMANKIRNERKLVDSQSNLNYAKAQQIRTETPWIDRLNSINYDKMVSEIKVNEQKVNESIQSVRESISRISLNDSTIEVNGSKISLYKSEENLNMAKSFVEKLNAQKLSILMPYVESAEKARIALEEASTEAAIASASKSYQDASLALLKETVEQGLIDKGYYDSVVQKSEFDAKSSKRSYKWTPVQNIVHDFSLIAVGIGSVLKGVGSLD